MIRTIKQLPPATVIEYDEEKERDILKTVTPLEAAFYIAKGCKFINVKVLYFTKNVSYIQLHIAGWNLHELKKQKEEKTTTVDYYKLQEAYLDARLLCANIKRHVREMRRAEEKEVTFKGFPVYAKMEELLWV